MQALWEQRVLTSIPKTAAFTEASKKAARSQQVHGTRGARGEVFQKRLVQLLVENQGAILDDLRNNGLTIRSFDIAVGPEDIRVSARNGADTFIRDVNIKGLNGRNMASAYDLCARSTLVQTLFGEGETETVLYEVLQGYRTYVGEYWVWALRPHGEWLAAPITRMAKSTRGKFPVRISNARPNNVLVRGTSLTGVGAQHSEESIALELLDASPRGLRGYLIRELVVAGISPREAVRRTEEYEIKTVAGVILNRILRECPDSDNSSFVY